MKLIFKIFIILTTQAMFMKIQAREVILLENLGTHAEGTQALKILQEKFNIPRGLITYRNINGECIKNSEAIMQLCLKASGELDVVKVNRYAVENSLRVFLEMER